MIRQPTAALTVWVGWLLLGLGCATYPSQSAFNAMTDFGFRWTIKSQPQAIVDRIRQLSRSDKVQLKEERPSESQVTITTEYLPIKLPPEWRQKGRVAYGITLATSGDGNAQLVIVTCTVEIRGIYERTWTPSPATVPLISGRDEAVPCPSAFYSDLRALLTRMEVETQ